MPCDRFEPHTFAHKFMLAGGPALLITTAFPNALPARMAPSVISAVETSAVC
jgi:hypothetical protein